MAKSSLNYFMSHKEVAHWRHYCFPVPFRKAGNGFVNEIAGQYQVFGSASALMLPFYSPYFYPMKRRASGSNGDLNELVSEG